MKVFTKMVGRQVRPHAIFLWGVVLFSMLTSFQAWAGDKVSGGLTVYVVNYPLKYFAERIGGDHAKVVFPAPTDVDPAYWVPDIKTIMAYQKADLIVINGASYAKWIDKVTLPRFKIVNTSKRFRDQYITIEGAVTHSHGPEGEHAHEGIAFTTWLDFDLAAKQAKAVADALARKQPHLKDTFQKNYLSLEVDLMAIDQNIRAMVAEKYSQPLVASHPVYDYFSGRYKLNMKSVHWEPDEVPTAEQMVALKNMIKEHPAKWMIWEGEPIQTSVARLKTLGINSLVFDPCGNRPDKGDFLGVMKQNVENLKGAFQ
jgi:zinc transport system substrate-binding protein